MAYIITFPNGWFLRGTAATGEKERATVYQTLDQAQAGKEKAKQFYKSRVFKSMQIVKID